jgi:hypothetical protein
MHKPDRGAKFRRYLSEHNYSCILSKTKWQRLFEELELLRKQTNCLLDFRRKDVGDDDLYEPRWDGDIYHVLSGSERIEWIEIRAAVTTNRGRLLKTETRYYTNELVSAMRTANVPFSLTTEGVMAWGYVRAGTNIAWAS